MVNTQLMNRHVSHKAVVVNTQLMNRRVSHKAVEWLLHSL